VAFGSSAPTSSGPSGAKGNNQSKNIQASGRLLLGACLFMQYRLYFIGGLPSSSSDSVGIQTQIPIQNQPLARVELMAGLFLRECTKHINK
jgi:hypothetical protein